VHGDVAVAHAAARHRGAVAYGELKAAGLGRGAIDHRVGRSRLHRVHRGVFLVGHAVPADYAAQHAAVLALGPRAYISNRSALEQYEVLEAVEGPIHVTVIGRCRRSREGIRVHRTTRIAPEDLGLLNGHLPITSAARALLDFADDAPTRDLQRAINEAMVQGLTTADDLRGLLKRTPGRKGTALVTAILDRNDGPVTTFPGAEEVAYALFGRTPIPLPATNVMVLRYKVDFAWLDEKLIVEMDSGRFHGTPAAVDRDRRKEADLRSDKWEVLRYSWWQITEDSHFVVAEIAAALERRRHMARP
jgi:predicted transcriptional regulator of viral defense system